MPHKETEMTEAQQKKLTRRLTDLLKKAHAEINYLRSEDGATRLLTDMSLSANLAPRNDSNDEQFVLLHQSRYHVWKTFSDCCKSTKKNIDRILMSYFKITKTGLTLSKHDNRSAGAARQFCIDASSTYANLKAVRALVDTIEEQHNHWYEDKPFLKWAAVSLDEFNRLKNHKEAKFDDSCLKVEVL